MTSVFKSDSFSKHGESSMVRLQSQESVLHTQGQSFSSIMESVILSLDKNWNNSQKHLHSVIKSVPDNYKPMLEAQILVSNFSLQVELVTKVADGVQSTAKKLQQQSG